MESNKMTAGEYLTRLTMRGQQVKAQEIAARIAEMYREDPDGDGTKDDGTCNDCGLVFGDGDCQHGEFEPFILCDRCYLDRGGK